MLELNGLMPFIILLPLVAFLYASVGHGGASGYLALMALFNFEPSLMRPTALLLNIFVAGVSFFQYYRNGHFKWKLFFPFALSSIPAAFIGGYITLDTNVYKKILGVLLIFSILRIIGVFGKEHEDTKEVKILYGVIIGGIIGLFSGMIGIGGGIILSPVILLLHWGKMKETAAVSALFILVNSIAGLIGMVQHDVTFSSDSYLFVAIAFVGGTLGAYLGSYKMNHKLLKYLLAFVLAIASVKLLLV